MGQEMDAGFNKWFLSMYLRLPNMDNPDDLGRYVAWKAGNQSTMQALSHVNETPKNEHDSNDVLNKAGNVDMMREALRIEFPLLDEIGLDQELHHCEWSIQQERKRLHQLLDELQTEQALAVEPAPLVRLTDDRIREVDEQTQGGLIEFANAIMDAMQERNK